jgi:hypothetical protein
MRTKHRLVDAAMVLLLPLMMAYSLIGEAFHELAGTLITASRLCSSCCIISAL